MPLWRIFSHPSTFNHDQRINLAKTVTELYSPLPAFYVVVLFVDLTEDQVYVGGEAKTNFVRIVIEQIARTLPSPDTDKGKKYRKGWMDMINQALKPFIEDRPELQWEHHIYETPRDLWRIQGIDPPPPNSDAEKMWAELNKAVPYDLGPSI